MNDTHSPNDTNGHPIPPHRKPSNWLFCTLLRQVREKRQFTVDEAVRCLPGISAPRYQDWETGRRVPLSAVQTLVIWKLNTSPRPRALKEKRNSSGSIFAPSLPAAAFVAVIAATLAYHFLRPTPTTLAEYIAHDAPGSLFHRAAPEDFARYADGLKETLLSQFDADTREQIFAEYFEVAEPLLIQ